MFPGMNMNSRQMKQAMQRMGIQQQEIDAVEVIIRTEDKEYYFDAPEVSKVNMMGQKTFQIVGEPVERDLETDSTPDINEDDVKTVMDSANVDEETARKAIEDADGDLAEAILSLQED